MLQRVRTLGAHQRGAGWVQHAAAVDFRHHRAVVCHERSAMCFVLMSSKSSKAIGPPPNKRKGPQEHFPLTFPPVRNDGWTVPLDMTRMAMTLLLRDGRPLWAKAWQRSWSCQLGVFREWSFLRKSLSEIVLTKTQKLSISLTYSEKDGIPTHTQV